jgi:hypothetical protein
MANSFTERTSIFFCHRERRDPMLALERELQFASASQMASAGKPLERAGELESLDAA